MSQLFASDGAKILLLVGSFVGLYALSRWASRLNESNPTVLPPPEPQVPQPPEAPRPWSKVVPIDRRPQFHTSEVIDEAQLRRVLRNYASYYNQVRTHLSLDKNAPDFRRPQKIGHIAAKEITRLLTEKYGSPKGKVLQILINLIRNAKHALEFSSKALKVGRTY